MRYAGSRFNRTLTRSCLLFIRRAELFYCIKKNHRVGTRWRWDDDPSGWLLGRSRVVLGALVVVVLHAVLVAHDLAVELVHQCIDGSVQVLGGVLDEDVAALDVEGDFGALPTFLFLVLLDRQQHGNVHDLVEVPRHAVELGEHVRSQSRGHDEMMAADRQIHWVSSSGGFVRETISHDRIIAMVAQSLFPDQLCGGTEVHPQGNGEGAV